MELLNFLISNLIILFSDKTDKLYFFTFAFGFLLFILIYSHCEIVSQEEEIVIERFGQFNRVLYPGLNFIFPVIDSVREKHDLREEVIDIDPQMGITTDNVSLSIDGVIFLKVVNSKLATYGTTDYRQSIIQLAKTSMRSAIGKMALDTTFEAREELNKTIVLAVNEAARPWGVQCMRYEIKDITVPSNVKKAMETQVAAERQKRSEILTSEGRKISTINIAEGKKREVELSSEAQMTEKINNAKGQSESIRLVADAQAEAMNKISLALKDENGRNAASIRLADNYLKAFTGFSERANTIILPSDLSNIASLIESGKSIYKSIEENNKTKK